ncbi:helix-turn-helix domain-containing protein [Marinicauda salina]|nr:helix-turn-helix transcriptional regulator [Marinicauda salina]
MLRALRMRTHLKQDALAAHLDVSQSYISRLEGGYVRPSAALQEKIEQLCADPRNRPMFDDWRMTVRRAFDFSTIISRDGDTVIAIEFSRGFKDLGEPFSAVEAGVDLEGALSPDADVQFTRFNDFGLFAGEVSAIDTIWRQGAGERAICFQAMNTAVRDDWRRWHVHTSHRRISQSDYDARRRAGEETLVLEE